ncbi:threonine synthase [uncultured Finegoldia sp.]|uniref:threonine synthase n=1 Tax=uncultured Finegoldia sp. TaxID=328009 RepID=UPI00261A5206|nr:threonine synthase [uncultured Finegoldia sp.]
MKFISTRDNSITINSQEVIFNCINDDIYVPVNLDNLYDIDVLRDMTYNELAIYILKHFLTDIDEDSIVSIVNNAYDGDEPNVFLRKTSDRCYVELFNNKSLSYRDLSLSIISKFIDINLSNNENVKNLYLFTASTDISVSMIENFKTMNTRVFVFYPKNISDIEKCKLLSTLSDNVCAIGVDGDFYQCKKLVDCLINDSDIKNLIAQKDSVISTCNSLNIIRVLTQVIYYFYSYVTMVKYGEVEAGKRINVSIPTENFGNIMACFYAKRMGLPINKIICATKSPLSFKKFLETGEFVYDEVFGKDSTSFERLVTANIERLLHHLLNNQVRVRQIYTNFRKTNKFVLNPDELSKLGCIETYSMTNDEISQKILRLFLECQYPLSPQTAMASLAYDKYVIDSYDYTPSMIMATTSPYSSTENVLKSFGCNENLDIKMALEKLNSFIKSPIPDNLQNIKEVDTTIFDSSEIKDIVYKKIQEMN